MEARAENAGQEIELIYFFKMKIGFIGLGKMGLGMAQNLSKNGFVVFGYDLENKKLVTAQKHKIIPCKSISELCEKTKIIILCLPHPEISKKVIFGEKGIIKSNKKPEIIIEISTLNPQDATEFYQKLSKNNIDFIGAPMFGGQTSAVSGNIWFVVEGKKEVLRKYKKVFSAMGKKFTYLGKPPQATIAKLCRNVCRFANVAVALEVVDFLRKYSYNIKPIYDLLVEDSKTNFDKVWERAIREYALKKESYRTSKISVKDLNLILKLSKDKNINMPITKITQKIHKELSK